MRSPIQAIVWEIWAANRRSWLVVLAIVPIWGVVCQLFSDNLQHSDAMKGLSFIPTMLTTCLLMSIFNFTETNPPRDLRVSHSDFSLCRFPPGRWLASRWYVAC